MTRSCTTGRWAQTAQCRDSASPVPVTSGAAGGSLVERTGMQAREDPFRRKSVMAQAILVAALLALFLLLHVLGGAVLQRTGAPDRSPSTPDLTLKSYD